MFFDSEAANGNVTSIDFGKNPALFSNRQPIPPSSSAKKQNHTLPKSITKNKSQRHNMTINYEEATDGVGATGSGSGNSTTTHLADLCDYL